MSSSPTESPSDRPTAIPADSTPSPLDDVSPQLITSGQPSRIGPYHILEIIGEGGMGVVYKAEQRHPVRRTVALKLVKLGMDSKQVIARFESERQALALMDHSNVARVLDAGTSESGRPFFVMEYVPGEPITRFCDRHHYTTRQRLELLIQACEAVQHAHQKAIIHRDLKPSNILVTLQDARPRVKVIDFGVAKATAQKLTEKTLVTETGQLLGTREYMSPEQVEVSPGAPGDVDTRSDVYSLGVVLYELLTGLLPFDPDELRGGDYARVQRIIREVDPPRPSTRLSSLGAGAATVAMRRQTDLTQLARELKSELEWIPLKAMRKDRTHRYATPIELAQDIENYLHHRPLIAAPESATYRLRKLVRRNKGPVIAAATVLIVLLAGITGTTIGLVGQSRQRALAEQQALRADREAQNAKKEAAEQQAVNYFLADMLSAADPDRLLGEKVTVLQATRAAVKRLDEGMLNDQPLIEADVRNTMGSVLRDLGRLEEAEPVLRKALELDRRFGPPGDTDIGQSLNNLAQVMQAQGRLADAEPLFREAVDVYRRAFPDGHPYTAIALKNHGTLLRALGKFAEAEMLFREALQIEEKHVPDNQPEIALSLNNLGWALQEQGRLDEAEPFLLKSLEIRRRSLPAGHPQVAQNLNMIGMLRQQQGRLAEAETLYREGLETYRKAMPAGHADVAASLSNLGLALHLQGKLAEAEPLFREAMDAYRKGLPSGHPSIGLGANNLALLLKDQGHLEEAESLQREAVKIFRDALPPGHPNIAKVISNLGLILEAAGKLEGAEKSYRQALENLNANAGPRANPTTQAANRLSEVLQQLGRKEEARRIRAEYALPLPAAQPVPAQHVPSTNPVSR